MAVNFGPLTSTLCVSPRSMRLAVRNRRQQPQELGGRSKQAFPMTCHVISSFDVPGCEQAIANNLQAFACPDIVSNQDRLREPFRDKFKVRAIGLQRHLTYLAIEPCQLIYSAETFIQRYTKYGLLSSPVGDPLASNEVRGCRVSPVSTN